MTPMEFKAWFEGFTESISFTPNAQQWTRIKERVAEIDGTPVTVQEANRWGQAVAFPYNPISSVASGGPLKATTSTLASTNTVRSLDQLTRNCGGTAETEQDITSYLVKLGATESRSLA